MTDFHAFQEGGENFLFFPRSARLYLISDSAAALLSDLSARGAETATGEAADQLRDLLRRELEVPHPASSLPPEPVGENSFQSFSLYLAQSCNMACCYCWNQGGCFGKAARLMGRRRALRSAKSIASLIEGSKAEKIFVNFYGGEPLLNFPALEAVVLDLRGQESRLGRKLHFTVDTNGILLEGRTASFLAEHFTRIGVSLDGREEIHDLQRTGKYGERTWQTITGNIEAFPSRNLLGLRATLTVFSDSYLETFLQLARLGVRRIQLEYCHDPGGPRGSFDQRLVVPQERQRAELVEFIDYYVEFISGYGESAEIPFVSSLLDSIARIRRGERLTRPCGAGMNTLAINSRGEIFPCIAFVDRKEYAMGRIGSGDCHDLNQTLAGLEVDEDSPCGACWLRYDCAGGCYATHYRRTGQVEGPHSEYCRSMRSKAEVYYYALAQMMKKCPWHLEGG